MDVLYIPKLDEIGTKGEGTINVTLGTHTFLKVKVESISRVEGERE